MKWKAKLCFKECAYRIVRQEIDSYGNSLGDSEATPYCPDGFLTLLYLKDDEGRAFQIGTDAIAIATELPPNTGSGLSIWNKGSFFDDSNGRRFEFREESLASCRWESEMFEIIDNFGSSCMTVGGFPLHKFAWPLFYGLLSRSSGPRNFD